MSVFRHLLSFFGFLLICAATQGASAQLVTTLLPSEFTPDEYLYTLKISGVERNYLVHPPEDYDELKPLPLVIFLHGAGGNALQSARTLGWEEKADKERFVVAFPNGAPADPSKPASFRKNPRIWEDGSFRSAMRTRKLDDTEFIKAVLIDLQKRYSIDRRRIYLVGFSNGGGMTFRLAAEIGDQIAAFACVSSLSWLPQPAPKIPLPLLYLLGTRDPLTPLNGGRIRSPWGTYETKPPVLDTVEKWLRWNLCGPTPTEQKDQKGVRTVLYSPRGREGAEVRFSLVTGMGHHYPGATETLAASIAGKPADKINGTEIIWNFLKRFRLKK